MNAMSFDDPLKPDQAVRALIERFGARATVAAMIRLAVHPRFLRARTVTADELPGWIRRDIGLAPGIAASRTGGALARPFPGLR